MESRTVSPPNQCASEEAQKTLMLKKIELQQNVSRCRDKLHRLQLKRGGFPLFQNEDISHFKPIAVFYVLKYLEIDDFVAAIAVCRD